MPRPRGESRVIGPTYIPSREAAGRAAYRVVVVDGEAAGSPGGRPARWFADAEEAERFAAKARKRLLTLKTTTIAQAIESYDAHLATKGTGDTRRETIRRLRAFFPNLDARVAGVTPERAQELYDAFRTRTKTTSDGDVVLISVAYHRAALINARSMFKWVAKAGLVGANPFAEVEGVGKRRRGKAQWTGDEAKRFVAYATPLAEAGDKNALGALMLLFMALRSADVCRLVVRDVDLDATVLRVDEGKTEKSNRPRHVPEALQAPLRKLAAGRDPFEPLFALRKKGKIHAHTRRWLEQALDKLCAAAGVPRVVPHALKGTAGSILAETGELSDRIADHLSHEKQATTEAHYVEKRKLEAARTRQGLSVITGGRR